MNETQPKSLTLITISALIVFIVFGGCKKSEPTASTPMTEPALVSPIDSAFINTNNVRLVWQKIPDAVQYQCQVSQTAEFATLEFDSTFAETTVVAMLSSHFRDYWRTRAKHSSGVWSAWSSPRNFNRWVTIREGNLVDEGNSVQQTTDGGFIIAGSTYPSDTTQRDVYLVKTDANGSVRWTRTFGGNSLDAGRSVQQTTDGGFIVGGETFSFVTSSTDVYLIKTDANGNQQWARTFGGSDHDQGYSVQQTTDGGFIIAGSTSSLGAGALDVFLIKTDVNGNEVWIRTFGGSGFDGGSSVWETADGGFIIAGSTSSLGAGGDDVYLIKTHANGDTSWTTTFGGSGNDYGSCVQQTTDGGYIVVGETYSFAANFTDIYLIKTNAEGNLQWVKTFGSCGGYDRGTFVRQTTEGGFVITGGGHVFFPTYASTDVLLIKTDVNGNEQWMRTYGSPVSDWANSVQQMTDGGFILVGAFGGASIFLIKTDANGNIGR